jgi:hypothetical protein
MDVITAAERVRGKVKLTVNGSEVISIPAALYRERPMEPGTEFDLGEYEDWLLLKQYRYALDRAVGYLAARACSRGEIEQKLLSGEAQASDVPRLWADGYRRYLGITEYDMAHGPLQDSHWAAGALGYFPAYVLGNAFGAQFRATMLREGMDFEGICASGDLSPIHSWLRERIWRFGRSRDSRELVRGACGENFSATFFTDYLVEKYSELYQLS